MQSFAVAVRAVVALLGALLLGLALLDRPSDPRGSLGLLCLLIAAVWGIKPDIAEQERLLTERIYRLEQQAEGPRSDGGA
jgi:hypothetical protein